MLRVCYDNTYGEGDLVCDSTTGHDTTKALETAVILSLFCDRRAQDDDDIPEDTDRRGWWADAYAVVTNDKWGSRLWQLERGKASGGALLFAREAAEEALQWLIDDGIARDVQASASYIAGRKGVMRLTVQIFKPERTTPQKFGPWEAYYAV